jgi:hypothetical protein
MHSQRFAGPCPFFTLAALLLALLVTTPARAEIGTRQDQTEESRDTQEEATAQLTDEQRLRALAILFSTMTWSGQFPPPDHPPPMVVKPPFRSSRWKPPHHTNSGGTPHTSGFSPEPATMTTAVLGSGLACLFSWLRKRRSRRVAIVS